jgi:hypothetical protein
MWTDLHFLLLAACSLRIVHRLPGKSSMSETGKGRTYSRPQLRRLPPTLELAELFHGRVPPALIPLPEEPDAERPRAARK